MKFLANLVWLILGGLLVALIYYLVGLLLCVTIIGIPFGVQLFKLGTYALWPFGREATFAPDEPGLLSILMNVLWILLGWWEIALIHAFFGLILCITIVGIPWGVKHFQLAVMALTPFGKRLVPKRD